MSYIFIDKTKGIDEAKIYKSIQALSRGTPLKEDTLYLSFSRLKKTKYENTKYKILKKDILNG